MIGVDWSRDKIDVYDPRQEKVKIFSNLEEVAENYPGTFLVLEATAESYELQRREKVLQAFEDNDVQAYCFPSKRTAKFRVENNIKKSDAKDAKVIYCIGTQTELALHRFGPLFGNDKIRNEIEPAVIEDRYLYDGEQCYAVATKLLTGVTIPVEFRDFIFTGKKFRKQIGRILIAAQAVKKAGRGYREFRRIIGNYSNGYASILRSEYYWWWIRTVLNARLKLTDIKKKYSERVNEKTGTPMKIRIWSDRELKIRKQVMRQAVKAAQFLWRQA